MIVVLFKMGDSVNEIITYLREVVISNLISNWKESINSLNYRIGTITSVEYSQYLNAINRSYTSEIALLAHGIMESSSDSTSNESSEPMESRSNSAKNSDVNYGELANIAGNLFGMIVNPSSNVNEEDID